MCEFIVIISICTTFSVAFTIGYRVGIRDIKNIKGAKEGIDKINEVADKVNGILEGYVLRMKKIYDLTTGRRATENPRSVISKIKRIAKKTLEQK